MSYFGQILKQHVSFTKEGNPTVHWEEKNKPYQGGG